jgi:hypothetical protein
VSDFIHSYFGDAIASVTALAKALAFRIVKKEELCITYLAETRSIKRHAERQIETQNTGQK